MKILYTILILIFTVNFAFAQDYALQQLEESPRHHEWVEVESGNRTIHSFVVYPEVSENVTAVIVIHENRGLTDWVRSFADQVAAAGYIAIAPDLLSDFDENHSRSSDYENTDAARDALYQLEPGQITEDLNAVKDYISSIPSSNGNVVVSGFCWGGSQTFRFATNARGYLQPLFFMAVRPPMKNRSAIFPRLCMDFTEVMISELMPRSRKHRL